MNFHEFKDHFSDVFEEVTEHLRFVADETDRELEIVKILAQIIANHSAKWVWANKSLLKETKRDFIKALILGFSLPLFIDTYHYHFDQFGPELLDLYNAGASYEALEKVVLKGMGVYRELADG